MAIIWLAVIRNLQGVAIGRNQDGLPSLLALSVPAKRRGWYAKIPQLGTVIAFYQNRKLDASEGLQTTGSTVVNVRYRSASTACSWLKSADPTWPWTMGQGPSRRGAPFIAQQTKDVSFV